MLLTEKSSARAARNPLPPKLAALVREFWWFALVGLALYLLLILSTYSKSDPGWSRSVSVPAIENAGGRVGAWLADVMLYRSEEHTSELQSQSNLVCRLLLEKKKKKQKK